MKKERKKERERERQRQRDRERESFIQKFHANSPEKVHFGGFAGTQ
jgi:hypothetical protein